MRSCTSLPLLSLFSSWVLIVVSIDVMFMNDRAFEYEPHYENWMKRREKEN